MVGRNYFNRNNGPSHLRGKSCNVNVQAGRIANADPNTLRMPVGVHTFLISQNVARLCIVQFRIVRSAYRPFIIVIGDHEAVCFCLHSRHHQHLRWFSQLIFPLGFPANPRELLALKRISYNYIPVLFSNVGTHLERSNWKFLFTAVETVCNMDTNEIMVMRSSTTRKDILKIL